MISTVSDMLSLEPKWRKIEDFMLMPMICLVVNLFRNSIKTFLKDSDMCQKPQKFQIVLFNSKLCPNYDFYIICFKVIAVITAKLKF